MSAPLFSIVTVTLNCAEAAVRTAQSVLGQDFADYEYIVKDGGSQDNTVERLRELGVSVHGSPDVGIYDAMNQALALCKGDYVYFLNGGDTFFENGVLSRVASQLDPASALIYGDVMRQPWGGRTNYPPSLSRYYLFSKNICHQAWLARRDVYNRLGGFIVKSPLATLRQPIAADQEFLWRLLLRERLPAQKVDVVLANYPYGGYSTGGGIGAQNRRERWLLLRQFYSRWELFYFGLRSLYFLKPLKAAIWGSMHKDK
jgi:putative colanic acid biosynthesis glycosyltransferase